MCNSKPVDKPLTGITNKTHGVFRRREKMSKETNSADVPVGRVICFTM